MCQNERKITLHHVVRPTVYADRGTELTHQSRVNTSGQKASTMPITEPVLLIRHLHLCNDMTSGPYGRASQQDRWTEYHDKMLNRASLWTDRCRLMKCSIRPYAETDK